jgi:hypothetical protein
MLHILRKLDLDQSIFRASSTIHSSPLTAHNDEVMSQPRCFTKTQRGQLPAPLCNIHSGWRVWIIEKNGKRWENKQAY